MSHPGRNRKYYPNFTSPPPRVGGRCKTERETAVTIVPSGAMSEAPAPTPAPAKVPSKQASEELPPATVQVAVRVRPYNTRERELKKGCCVRMLTPSVGEVKLIVPKDKIAEQLSSNKVTEHSFNFDFAYWSHDGYEIGDDGRQVPSDPYNGKGHGVQYADQHRVFQDLGLPILLSSFQGHDACIFAYGQTGSGKSYSVFGPAKDPGIIPMAGKEIFALSEQENGITMNVRVSVLEIYNEIVRDLLDFETKKSAPGPKKEKEEGLRIIQKPEGIVVLTQEGKDRNWQAVQSYEEVETLIDAAMSQRTIASTLMNA
eukprot:7389649-Prymnesium_polylepis.1